MCRQSGGRQCQTPALLRGQHPGRIGLFQRLHPFDRHAPLLQFRQFGPQQHAGRPLLISPLVLHPQQFPPAVEQPQHERFVQQRVVAAIGQVDQERLLIGVERLPSREIAQFAFGREGQFATGQGDRGPGASERGGDPGDRLQIGEFLAEQAGHLANAREGSRPGPTSTNSVARAER